MHFLLNGSTFCESKMSGTVNLIALAIRRPTAVAMFFLAILFTGIASLSRLPLDLTPELSFPKLSVVTYWPNTSPETIEALVTSPIEAAANTVAHVKKIDSISEEGQSTVNIEFARGADMDFAALELSEKLSLLKEDLPFGVQPPQIQKYVPKEFQSGGFLSYHLVGPMSLLEIRRFALERLRGPLFAVEGVADVQVLGGQDSQLQIELDPAKLRALDLSEQAVAAALRDVNVRATAGRIYQGSTKYDLIIDNPLNRIDEISEMIVSANHGAVVRLRDVGRVYSGYSEPRNLTRIDGQPAIVINIEKEAGANTIVVADRIFARLAELQKKFPPSVRLIKERDQSERIRSELTNLASRSLFCIAVIFLVLLAFLRNVIRPLVILATIFFSVLLTINFFYFAGIGLNLLTLAGLALGFGMMVDNSIVVFENISRYHDRGAGVSAAAEQGARDVALPIIASTLTTVAVFIPFLYMTGELRIYYLPFTIAIGLALLASLLVAFTFTPSLAAVVMKRIELRRSKIEDGGLKLEDGGWKIEDRKVELNAFAPKSQFDFYTRLLAWSLRHRFVVIMLTVGLFAGSYYLFEKFVTKGRIWAWGEDTYIVVFIHMPTGSEIERTDEIVRKFEDSVVGNSKVAKVFTTVAPEFARMEITFPPDVQRSIFPLLLKEQITAQAVQIGGPAVGVYGYGQGFYSGGGAAPQYHLQVLGYHYDEVKRFAEEVGRKLARSPRVHDVDTNSAFGYRQRDDLFEMVLAIDREKLQRAHLSTTGVLNAVQNYLRENLDWQRLKIAGIEMEYRMKMAGHSDFDIEDLRRLVIQTSSKEQVRLSEVAQIGERKVLAQIVRQDQQYVRGISFEYRGPWKFGDRLVESVIKNTQLPPGYRLERGSFFFLQGEEKRQIFGALMLAVLLVYMVTAGLFESLKQPFIIMLTVPMALLGVFLIFYLTDTNFDRSAYIGVILLAGIVVNNAILLVHHIKMLRQKGLSIVDAAIQGSIERARPILMTTSTTVLGLLPLVLFVRTDESLWYALALATVGGLVSSTLLVLLIIPVACVSLLK